MSDVAMPRLSDSMEEGTILRWLASDGEQIERGQELAEIETDKASMVYEADGAGVLHIIAAEGETLAVGAPIAQLLADGEKPSQPAASGAPDAEGQAQAGQAQQADARQTADPAAGAAEATPAAERPSDGAEDGAANGLRRPSGPQRPLAGERVKASPLARRLAAEADLDLSAIQGSGPGGRIVKVDVEQAKQEPAPATGAPATEAAPLPGGAGAGAKGGTEVRELTRTQALIARRMAEAKATIPEFTLSCEIDMEAAVEMRRSLKRLGERTERQAPSVNDMVVRACALALREHPRANGTYRDGSFELHERVNVGFAVASPDALLVPVIRDADRLSVFEIAAAARRLAAAARDGTITPPELSGGTFSVSNLGMYGIDSFTAVINPPQAAILAVGSLAQRPVVRDGGLTVAHTMSVTLACDHRILYGADAAEFLGAIREHLQEPLSLLA